MSHQPLERNTKECRSELYDIVVKGGAPIWQWASVSNWGKRAYIAGPFQPK